MNNNIRIAFERYLEFQSAQRRASMLQWCLKFADGPLEPRRLQRHTMMLVPLILNFSRVRLRQVQNNLRLWRKEFTTSRTRYFDNNFDMLTNRDTSPSNIIDTAHSKLGEVERLLGKRAREGGYSQFDKVLADKVCSTFNWLYGNGLYSMCYQLVQKMPEPHYCWFKKVDAVSLVRVTDKYGTPTNLLKLFLARSPSELVSPLLLANQLIEDSSISPLVRLLKSSPEEFESILDEILQSGPHSDEFNGVLTKICAPRLKESTVSKLIASSIPKSVYNVKLVEQIYNIKFATAGAQKALETLKMITEDSSVSYRRKRDFVFAALRRGSRRPLQSFVLWVSLFPDVTLDYDQVPAEINCLKNRWVFQGQEVSLDNTGLSDSVLSRVISVMIYCYTMEGPNPYVVALYDYKKKQGLDVVESDRIGLLRSFVELKKYGEALDLVGDWNTNSEIVLDNYNAVFLSLAKTKKWDDLKELFDGLTEKGKIASLQQYSVMFMVLASRGATKYVLELWDTLLQRGFSPDESILSSIILCFIHTHSYTKALQWFSAYSYYHVQLGTRSYGLMLRALACTHDFESCFKLLDELCQKGVHLSALQLQPLLEQCASLGDFKSVELVLSHHFAAFGLPVTNSDSRWILKAHLYAGRFGVVVEAYEKKGESVEYADTLLALEAASKFTDVSKFYQLWARALKLYPDQMTVQAYNLFVGVHVRVHRLKGIPQILDSVQRRFKLTSAPSKMFCEMIFSSIRMGRPWDSPKVVRMALTNGVVPTPKMYSLLLQSNTSLYSYSEQHIDETMQLLNEILVNRKRDKLGKLDRDLNPMSFKLVLMHVIRFRGVVEARKYFELYVENSRNYLLDNVHILHIELLLLGEEARWEEFSGCYERFLSILHSKMQYSRVRKQESYDNIDPDRMHQLLVQTDAVSVNEMSLRKSTSIHVGIPTSLKKALFSVWHYRLRQLTDMEQLDEVPAMVDKLYEEGFVLSNKNINETALVMSTRENLVQETVVFINKYMLPGQMVKIRQSEQLMRYRMRRIPGMRDPDIRLIESTRKEILNNISDMLDDLLTPKQKDLLLQSIQLSRSATVIHGLKRQRSSELSDRIHESLMARGAMRFYRLQHRETRYSRLAYGKMKKADRIDQRIDYRHRWLLLKEKKDVLLKQLSMGSSAKKPELLVEMSKVKGGFTKLRADRKEAVQNMRLEERKEALLESRRVYKIGRINLFRLNKPANE